MIKDYLVAYSGSTKMQIFHWGYMLYKYIKVVLGTKSHAIEMILQCRQAYYRKVIKII